MIAGIDLWDPSHVNLTADLLTAFLLGLVHGITPDEHTWPITFSYAIGSYSTWRGLRAGLVFSLAFTVQQALASELAHLGLAGWFTFGPLDAIVYIIVGVVMAAAGLSIGGHGVLPHIHLPGFERFGRSISEPRELRPWMPAVHGFIAGWGIDAFSLIIYTTLAPAAPSAATGWLPGLFFGIGTLCMQAAAGAAFGLWAASRGLPPFALRSIALTTAARTLLWGGLAFVLFGLFALAFPEAADITIATRLRVHNLDTIGLPFVLVILTVAGIGITSFVSATQAWRRRLVGDAAAVRLP